MLMFFCYNFTRVIGPESGSFKALLKPYSTQDSVEQLHYFLFYFILFEIVLTCWINYFEVSFNIAYDYLGFLYATCLKNYTY